jgi:hypothetical protein
MDHQQAQEGFEEAAILEAASVVAVVAQEDFEVGSRIEEASAEALVVEAAEAGLATSLMGMVQVLQMALPPVLEDHEERVALVEVEAIEEPMEGMTIAMAGAHTTIGPVEVAAIASLLALAAVAATAAAIEEVSETVTAKVGMAGTNTENDHTKATNTTIHDQSEDTKANTSTVIATFSPLLLTING